MPQIEIRPAIGSDLIRLASLDHSYQSSHVWQMDISPDEGQFGISFREIRLPRPVRVEYPRTPEKLVAGWQKQCTLLAGFMDSLPVGYICLSEGIIPTAAWVTDLAVDPSLRRQGIGSALIIAGQDWSSQRRHRRMIMEVQSKNQPAIRMAKKLGFEFCGYNDHYYENQDIALFFGLFIR